MISAVLLASSAALWSYFGNLQQKLPAASTDQVARTIAETVVTRVKMILLRTMNQGATYCPDLSDFRDLSVTSPADVSYSFTPPAVAAGWQIDCLLRASEAKTLNSLKVTVSSGANPDFASLSRQVRVTVAAAAVQGSSTGKTVTVARNYLLHVPLVSMFNVIFVRNGSTEPGIDAGTGSIEFKGSVFHSVRHTPGTAMTFSDFLALPTAATLNPKIVFHNLLYVRADYVDMGASLDPKQMKRALTAGLETGVLQFSTGLTFNNTMVLPPENTGAGNAWYERLDYTAKPTPPPGPLPGLSCLNNKTDGTTPTATSRAEEGTDTLNNFSNTATTTGGTQNLTLPDTTKGFDRLIDTCKSGKTFVFERPADDLTLDFAVTTTPATTASERVFCGLVFAKTLIINVNSSGDHVLLGNFIVNKIQVTGGTGKVHVFSPSEEVKFPGTITLPSPQTTTGLYSQFIDHSSDITHNFFTPLSYRAIDTSIRPAFRPACTVPVTLPAASEYSGYMEICSLPSACPAGDVPRHYCQKANLDRIDYAPLFTAGPSPFTKQHNNLVWVAEETL